MRQGVPHGSLFFQKQVDSLCVTHIYLCTVFFHSRGQNWSMLERHMVWERDGVDVYQWLMCKFNYTYIVGLSAVRGVYGRELWHHGNTERRWIMKPLKCMGNELLLKLVVFLLVFTANRSKRKYWYACVCGCCMFGSTYSCRWINNNLWYDAVFECSILCPVAHEPRCCREGQ